MSQFTNTARIPFSKAFVGSLFLALTILASLSTPTVNALAITNNNVQDVRKRIVTDPHSPFARPDAPSNPALHQGGARKKRSLYSHINGDIQPKVATPELHQEGEGGQMEVVILSEKHTNQNYNRNNNIYDTSNQPKQTSTDDVQEQLDISVGVGMDMDFEEDVDGDEIRTLIEPRYPSIDLFQDGDDDEEQQQDNDDDSVERPLGYGGMPEEGDDLGQFEDDQDEDEEEREERERLALDHDGTYTQGESVWMVDEWEEELEGEMDELMEWIEEDTVPSGLPPTKSDSISPRDKAKIMGSGRLRDRQGSFTDETSRFQRLFSDSWLF